MSICNAFGQFAQHLNIQNTPTHPVRSNIIYKQSTFDTVYVCHFIRSRHSIHQRPPYPHPRKSPPPPPLSRPPRCSPPLLPPSSVSVHWNWNGRRCIGHREEDREQENRQDFDASTPAEGAGLATRGDTLLSITRECTPTLILQRTYLCFRYRSNLQYINT